MQDGQAEVELDVEEGQPLLFSENQNLLRSRSSSPQATATTVPVPKQLTTLQLVLLCSYSVGFGALWTFLLVVAIPKQVATLSDVTELTKGRALGTVMLFGGLISTVEPPLVGYCSDRTQSRFGRRKPYMVVGSVALVLTMLLLPHATTLSSFVLIYVGLQFFSNISSSANLGLMPDLVPKAQLGKASGMMGAMGAMGQLIGASSGVLVSRIGLQTCFYLLSGLYLATTMVTICCVVEGTGKGTGKDKQDDSNDSNDCEHIARGTATSTVGTVGTVGTINATNTTNTTNATNATNTTNATNEVSNSLLATFTDALIHNHDFRWVFITRLLYNMGIYSVQEFLQYYVKDVIPLKGWSATTEVSLLFVPLLLGALVSAYYSGKLSDKWGGRRKIFIYSSGVAQVLICLVFMFNTSVGFAGCLALMFGLASGAYAAVDFAMVLDVLPSSENTARDLGVWHVSLVLPQLLSTPLSGYVLDVVRTNVSVRAGYSGIFLLSAVWFGLSTVLVVNIKGVK